MAHELGCRCLPRHTSSFSRRDFTLSQLFACLVVRAHQKKSYRGVEALLHDTDWCQRLGMSRVPDHNTLCRAAGFLLKQSTLVKLLDASVDWFAEIGRLKSRLGIDSSHFESHHASRHYEQRCRRMAARRAGQKPDKRGSYTRSGAMAHIPKLTIGVDVSSHVILSALATTGMGSDDNQFEPVLFDAWRRAPIKRVVADAGYDSEKNHRLARLDMGIVSLIPATKGRPHRSGRHNGHFRRMMQKRFKRDGGGKFYRQRAQTETTNSMIKRNLGSELRCRTPKRRERELILLTIVHNIMLLLRRYLGSRQSPLSPLYSLMEVQVP